MSTEGLGLESYETGLDLDVALEIGWVEDLSVSAFGR